MTTDSDFLATGMQQAAARAVPRHTLSRDVAAGVYPVVPPELLTLVEAENKLVDLQHSLDSLQQDAYVDFLRRMTDDLAAGGNALPTDPAAFLDAANSPTRDEQALTVARLTVRNLQDNLSHRWKSAASRHADAMLAGLRDKLTDVVQRTHDAVTHLRGLDPTDGLAIATAEPEQRAAITALFDLRRDYLDVRRLQRRLVETVQDEPWTESGFEVPEPWRVLWDSRVHEFRNGAPPPPAQEVLWFQDLVLEPWLPSLDDLADAWHDIRPRFTHADGTRTR